MGEVINFQEAKKWLENNPRELRERRKVRLSYITDDSRGIQISIASISYMTLNKVLKTVYIWYGGIPENDKGELLNIPYDVALKYDTLEQAYGSFKEIEEAVRNFRESLL